MDLLTTTESQKAWSLKARDAHSVIGAVPTMGALHDGHLSLIEAALEQCDRVVCSIFVNPLQFNDPKDLERYPRQLDADRSLLTKAGCHALFAPGSEDLFAGHSQKKYDLAGLDEVMEGPLRPGHFQGVVNVVERLFHYIRPHRAYFGKKDRQQLAIIEHVFGDVIPPIRIQGCPTLRELDGLAMSSRNELIPKEQRKLATALYKALCLAAEDAFKLSPATLEQQCFEVLDRVPGVRAEYFSIVDPKDLVPIKEWQEVHHAVACVAAYVGQVRLIDNMDLYR